MFRNCVVPAVVFSIVLSSCESESPTQSRTKSESPPATPAAPLVLSAPEVTLSKLTDSLAVTATISGKAAPNLSITLSSETRWLHDQPVVDASALGRGVVKATSAGTAVLKVSATGATPATLTVRVAPHRPVAMFFQKPLRVGDADTLVLRGYRMDTIRPDQLAVEDSRITVLTRDSANLRFHVSSMASEGCWGAARATLKITDVDVATDLNLLRKRSGEVSLGVGEVAMLNEECVRLAPADGSRYALAFLDTRAIESARNASEVRTLPDYSVTISDQTAAVSSASLGLSRVGQSQSVTEHNVVLSSAAATGDATTYPYARSTPWKVGEKFPYYFGNNANRAATARVLNIYGDYFVVAMVEGDSVAGTERLIAQIDSAMSQVLTHSLPMLQSALSEARPVSSAGSAQMLLIIVRDDSCLGGGKSFSHVTGGATPDIASWIHIDTRAAKSSAPGAASFLTHEITHTFQRKYLFDTRPAGQQGSAGAATWAMEGGAEFFASEVNRATAGIDPLSNYDWHAPAPSVPAAQYGAWASINTGVMIEGYRHGTLFFRDMINRRVLSGDAWPSAVREVIRGTLEGWFGYDALGGQREGLARRMQRSLGSSWNPAESLLMWAVSEGVDDMTSNRALQNHSYLKASQGRDGRGWKPSAVLDTGTGAVANVTRKYGSPGYFHINDDGKGGSLKVGANIPGVRWMIVRYQ